MSPGEKGEQITPNSARNVPPLLPGTDRGYMVGEERDKHGGKQVELRGRDTQTDK